MSVASRNPFALLDDEPSAPAAPAPAKKESAPAPAAPAKKSNAPRGGKYPSRGGGRPRDSAPADEPAEDGGRRKFDGEGRGRGRGGRGRGDRGGRGRGGARGERLDRHSATGKTDTEKKVSQGWGADEGTAELNAEVSGAADAAADAWGAPAAAEGEADPWATAATPAEGAAAPAEGDAKGDDRRRRERTPEEEDNTVSYEEYLAQKAAAADAEQHELRTANDGADDWTSSVQELKKSDDDAFFVGKQKSAPKAKAKKEDKVFLEIDARFERPQRGGFGGRGGRGEGRGRGRGEGRGRGRGEGRGRGSAPRQAAATFNVDDQSAFPSLS